MLARDKWLVVNNTKPLSLSSEESPHQKSSILNLNYALSYSIDDQPGHIGS